MPPWGAIKGFGNFRNEQALTQEQISLIADWVEGGIARGTNPRTLPPVPKFDTPRAFRLPAGVFIIEGNSTLPRAMTLDGIFPERVPAGASLQVVAALPNGDVVPLIWLYEYRSSEAHPFLFRKPVDLPAGTIVRVPSGAKLALLPVAFENHGAPDR